MIYKSFYLNNMSSQFIIADDLEDRPFNGIYDNENKKPS